MKIIQSVKNEKVKQWKKLLMKKGRDRFNLFLVEGEHLVEEALRAGAAVELMATSGSRIEDADDTIQKYVISEEIAEAISDTEMPQGIFAVCRKAEDRAIQGRRFLLIDAVQDPGNLGTLIRTADAAGVDAVIVGKGSADVYQPKVVRAAQGSHFHLPVASGDLRGWVEKLKGNGIPVYGTDLSGGISMGQVEPGCPFALIVGNEGAGVDPYLLKETDQNLYIPIYGKAESLNVAVAAGILLYYLRGNLG